MLWKLLHEHVEASGSLGTQSNLSLGLNTKNQITNTGFTYDASGDVLTDKVTTYAWDAESQIKRSLVSTTLTTATVTVSKNPAARSTGTELAPKSLTSPTPMATSPTSTSHKFRLLRSDVVKLF